MPSYDGHADFLLPDGSFFQVDVHAGTRGEQWAGTVALPDEARRLEQGDVCRITARPFGELRVIITEQRGSRRYAFVGLVRPDPNERLDPPR